MTPERRARLTELIDALCDGAIAPAEAARLEEELLHDREAQWFYIRRLHLFGNLLWNCETRSEWQALARLKEIGKTVPVPCVPSSHPPVHGPFTGAVHGAVGFFSELTPFSYLVATVLFGIGLLIGSYVTISRPNVGGDSSRQTPNVAQDNRRQESPPTVGRITALADCRWKQWRGESGEWTAGNPEIPESPNPQIPVSLGDKYRLVSGFMEITYDTGAKVILEGPCTYAVESARSGFLAIGRLTALVEKGEGRRVKGERGAGSRLSTLDSRLFSVRTPTAIVIDLGTEFGVEVEKSGTTRSHVFQGTVELRTDNRRGLAASSPSSSILREGESASVERGTDNTVAIVRKPGWPGRFVRQMPGGQVESLESRVQSQGRQLDGSRPSTLNSRLRYRLTDLGTIGGEGSCASGINAAGQVVGEATTTDGVVHAFLYANGKMKDLDALHDGESHAYDINSFGQIVGKLGRDDKGEDRAFLYSNGHMKDIGTLGGKTACAYAINDAGQIVGAARDASGAMRAFLYTRKTGMKDLRALGGPNVASQANDINASGQVAGHVTMPDGSTKPFLYTPGAGAKNLDTLGGRTAIAFNMNDAGWVVGMANASDGVLRVLFYGDGGRMRDLGVLKTPGDNCRFMLDVNNAGQVLCSVIRIIPNRGLLGRAYLVHNGQFIDLNSLIDPATGWVLVHAAAINDSGQIVGRGKTPDGDLRAFLLTPAGEAKDERRGTRDRQKTED